MKASKRKRESIIRQGERFIEERGGVRREDRNSLSSSEWYLSTRAGALRICFDKPDRSMLTIFCRFDEPLRAMQYVKSSGVNRYSGKWNHHWLPEEDLDMRLKLFCEDIEELTR